MFLFLQSWRATLIPALTLPVSLVGTFAFVKLLGFSINTLTLFAIVLATGIVVDDAIVVIENIERHIQEYGKRRGTRRVRRDDARCSAPSSRRRSRSISVFVPVAFFPGTTGRLYAQFALTIAFAVVLSDVQRADADAGALGAAAPSRSGSTARGGSSAPSRRRSGAAPTSTSACCRG